jgi:uncharacterized protein YndB with AHSA1/START domain
VLTEQRHVARWWGEHVDLDARPGGRLVETWVDDGRVVVTSGEVTRCEPPRALEMSWADEGWPSPTSVAFRLAEHEGGTRLVLEHTGWDVHPAGERQALIDAHVAGWSRHLGRLAEQAASGWPVG